jgi:hypothetical protein
MTWMSFLGRRKSAWMRIFARARDRRGAKRPRRNAPGPEAKPEPRIARFFAAFRLRRKAAKNAHNDLRKKKMLSPWGPRLSLTFGGIILIIRKDGCSNESENSGLIRTL